MASSNDPHRHYQQIAKAIAFLNDKQSQQPELKDVAAHIGLSDSHLQRVFTEWAGLSPKQFLQFLTKQKAKTLLADNTVANAAYDSGLSTSSRLHDLMVSYESVTPGEYKSGGHGIAIHYGIHPTPFGLGLIATTKRGLCKLSFFDSLDAESEVINELHQEWPKATIQHSVDATQDIANKIFSRKPEPLAILCKGTPFQLLVWEALLKIPEGELRSYQQVARQIGKPSATRAVASAIAKNSIAYLIPCHRVIRSTGEINQYRWGAERKQALIARECSRL
jgi:AraC family transcriptional regulator of adaptative response/methylated-DNA-[protein]-cysteine methyltransferase